VKTTKKKRRTQLSYQRLFELEVRIARRADELVRMATNPCSSLECWLRAEREVFAAIVSLRSFRAVRARVEI
jgi:hypothetical protein